MGEFERPGGQGALILDRQNTRLARGHGYQHGNKISRNSLR
jgi:hypothetical protein